MFLTLLQSSLNTLKFTPRPIPQISPICPESYILWGYGKINCVNIQFVKLWYSRCFRFARFPFTTVGIQAKREHIDSGLQSLFGFEKTRQRLFYLWFTYDSTSKNVGKFTVFKNHQKSPISNFCNLLFFMRKFELHNFGLFQTLPKIVDFANRTSDLRCDFTRSEIVNWVTFF